MTAVSVAAGIRFHPEAAEPRLSRGVIGLAEIPAVVKRQSVFYKNRQTSGINRTFQHEETLGGCSGTL